MVINQKNALTLWNERYGKSVQAIEDFSGRRITKAQFGDTNSKSGWTIDHRLPKSKGGSNVKCNLEIVHHKTNEEKANKICFVANERHFRVKNSKDGEKCYEIVEDVKL
ncbi:MAG: HNH endonuclease [Bacillota bacterium]